MHRSLLLAGMCLASFAFSPLSASAGSISPPPFAAKPLASPVHYDWWRYRGRHRERYDRYNSYERYCARLRRTCMYKHERGEVGEGNCRRYRHECGR